jgi:hypothetical protein
MAALLGLDCDRIEAAADGAPATQGGMMEKLPDEPNQRFGKPWPAFMDYIFDANMMDGTVRMIASAAVFAVVFGGLFWLLD